LMSKPAESFGVSDVLLVMMIPFNVVGPAGDYPFRRRFLVEKSVVKAGVRISFRSMGGD